MYLGFHVVKRPQGDFELLGIRSGVFGTYNVGLGFYPTQASAEAAMAVVLAPTPETTSQYDATGKKL